MDYLIPEKNRFSLVRVTDYADFSCSVVNVGFSAARLIILFYYMRHRRLNPKLIRTPIFIIPISPLLKRGTSTNRNERSKSFDEVISAFMNIVDDDK